MVKTSIRTVLKGKDIDDPIVEYLAGVITEAQVNTPIELFNVLGELLEDYELADNKQDAKALCHKLFIQLNAKTSVHSQVQKDAIDDKETVKKNGRKTHSKKKVRQEKNKGTSSNTTNNTKVKKMQNQRKQKSNRIVDHNNFVHTSENPMQIEKYDDEEIIETGVKGTNEQTHHAVSEENRNKLRVGMGLQALYYEDGKWYNAVMEAINSDGTFLIKFLGYGNQEIVSLHQIKVQACVLNPSVSKGKLLAAPVKIGELTMNSKAKQKRGKYRGIDLAKAEAKALSLRRQLKKDKEEEMKQQLMKRRQEARYRKAEKMRAEALKLYLKSANQGSRIKDVNIPNFCMSTPDGSQELLADSVLRFVPGRRYGLIGRNGIGKTTLLQLISYYEIPKFPTHLRVCHVEQEVKGENITVLQCVMNADIERKLLIKEEKELQSRMEKSEKEGDPDDEAGVRLEMVYDRMKQIDAWGAEGRASAILSGLSFSLERMQQPTKSLSGGWRMRVALAQALFVCPDILLLDEPTNHLDFPAVIWLEDYLQTYKNTLIIVSHDRVFLNNIITDVIHLYAKKLQYYRGNYDTFEQVRLEQIKNKKKQYEAIEAKKAHMKKFIDKFRYNAKRASLVQSRIKALNKLESIEKVEDESLFKFEFPEVDVLPLSIINCSDVSFGYTSDKILLTDVTCMIDQESRIAILGANGVGKSTLIHILLGNLEPLNGQCKRNREARIQTFTQHHMDQLKPDISPLELLIELFPNNHPQVIRRHLGKFGLSGNLALQRIYTLSGGQKSRVSFAIITWNRPHLIMMDEPTNHLDLETIDALIDAITKWNGGIVVVSHDQHFLNKIGKDFWGVTDGKVKRFENFGDAKKFSYSSAK